MDDMKSPHPRLLFHSSYAMPVLRRIACKIGPPSHMHYHIPGNTASSVCSSRAWNGLYSAACKQAVRFPDPTTSVEELLRNPEGRVVAEAAPGSRQAVAARQGRRSEAEDGRDRHPAAEEHRDRQPVVEEHRDRQPVVEEGPRWRSHSSLLVPLPAGPGLLPLFPGDASPRPLSRSPTPAALAPTRPGLLRVWPRVETPQPRGRCRGWVRPGDDVVADQTWCKMG